MDTTKIQKYYEKLSTIERFALLNAAMSRGDKNECSALNASAPKKQWKVPTTRGLVEAFEFLAMWHVMTMQENDSLFWLLEMIYTDKSEDNNNEMSEYVLPNGLYFGDLINLIRTRTLARDAAWRIVCKEYNIDPDKEIENYPGAVSIAFLVDVMKKYNELEPVEFDPTDYVNDFHTTIEHYRAMWE